MAIVLDPPIPTPPPTGATALAADRCDALAAPRRSWPRLVLVACMTLVIAELVTRALAPRIPEPLLWYHPTAQVKIGQMDAMAAAGVRTDIVFVGSSQTAEGIDPVRFASAVPGHPRTYNAAVLAGYPTVTARFVPEEVVPRLHPTTVVVGVSTDDLATFERPRYDESRAVDGSLLGRLDRAASGASALVHYRRELANPETWPTIAEGAADSEVAFYRRDTVGPQGEWRFWESNRCALVAADESAPELSWRANPERATALWSLVDSLRAGGIRVVLAVIPIGDCAFRMHHNGAADRTGRAVIAAGGAERGIPVLDVADQMTAPELYQDPGHMNAVGMARYTGLLAQRYAALRS